MDGRHPANMHLRASARYSEDSAQFFLLCKMFRYKNRWFLGVTVTQEHALLLLDGGPDSIMHGKERYDTRCYFNVRSKAYMSRLNLPHGNDN